MSTVEILINAQDNASSKLDNVGNSLERLGSKTGGIESSFVSLQKTISVGVVGAVAALGASLAGLTAVVTDGVGKAADLEQGVADIAAVMGVASDEVAPLKKLIGDLGMDPTLKVNSTEAADAIMQLAQSGISMSEIMDGAAKNVVLLSNATGGDMALSAAIASDAMALFGISAQDMAVAVNQITGVTVASKFGIEDYQYALAAVGGVASTLGVSFTDLNTTIAAISPSFAGGSDAGTSLKAMLSRLVPDSEEAAEAMRQIGLFSGMTAGEMENAQKQAKKLQDKIAALDPTSAEYAEKSALLNQQLQNVNASMVSGQNAFFNADGSMKSMSEITHLLQNALSGLSDEQKTATLNTIFLSDGVRAASALARIGSTEFDTLAASIGQVDAGQSAATRMDTFGGTMEVLAGIVDSLSIQIGDAFLPVLRNLAQWAINFTTKNGQALIGLFQQLAGVLDFVLGYFTATIERGTLMNEQFEKLPRAIQPIVEFVSSLATAVSRLLIQQEYWKDLLVAVGIVLTTILAPAIAGFLAAFAPVAALLGGIIVVVRKLRKTFAVQFGAIFDNLSHMIQLVLAWTSGMLTGWVSVEKGLKNVGDAFKIHLGRAYDQFLIIFNAVLAWVMNNLPIWLATLQSWAAAAWQWLVDVTPIVLEKIGAWGTTLIGWVTDNLPAWVATFQDWAAAVWQWLVDVVPVVLEKIGAWGAALIGWVTENLPAWVATFQDWAVAIWQWLVDVTPIAVEKIGAWGAALIGWVTENHPAWAASFSDWSVATWQWIVDATPTGTEKLVEWAETYYTWLGENLPDWIEAFLDWSLAMVEWIGEALPEAIRAIGNFVQGISDTGDEEGKSRFPGLVSGWAGALINWITNDLIPQVGPKFLLLMQKYAQAMLNIAVELGKLAIILAVKLWEWIVEVTPIAVEKLKEWGGALRDWITENLPAWIEKLREWGKAIWEWIVEVTPIAIEKLKKWGGALRGWITENLPAWIEKLREWGKAIWEWLVEVTPIAVEKLREWGGLLIAYLKEKLPEWLAQIYRWGRAVVEWLAEALPDALNAITDFIQNLSTSGEAEGEKSFIDMVKEWGATLIATVGPEFAKFVLEVVRLIGNLALELMRLGATLGISLILGLAEGLLDLVGIEVNLDEVKQTMFDTLNAGIDKAKNVGNNLIKAVQDGLSGDDAGLQKVAGNIWTVLDTEFKLSARLDAAVAWGRSFIASMNTGLSGQATTITTAVTSAWTTIDTQFKLTDRLTAAYNWGTGLMGELGKGVAATATATGTEAGKIWTAINNQFGIQSKLTSAYNWGTGLIGELGKGVAATATATGTEAGKIWTAINNQFGIQDKLTSAYNWGTGLIGELGKGVASTATAIGTEAGNIWTAISSKIGVASKLTNAYQWGTGLMGELGKGIASTATAIGTEAGNIWKAITDKIGVASKLTNAYQWGTGLMGELGKGIASTVTAVGAEAGKIWTAISNVLGTVKFEGIGSGILAGIQTGVASKIVELTGYITGGMQAIVDAVKRIFNIRSPSRVMADIGANLMIGMERGMINNIPGVINAAQLMAAGVLGVANGMSLSPSMALSASALGSASTGNIIRPSVTNNATYNLNYQTMQSAGSVQQDVELLNLLYGGAL